MPTPERLDHAALPKDNETQCVLESGDAMKKYRWTAEN